MLVLLFCAVGVAAGGWWQFETERQEVWAAAASHLGYIADSKAAQVAAWRTERTNDGLFLYNARSISHQVQGLLADPQSASAAAVREWLVAMQGTEHYYEACVFDAALRPRMRIPQDAPEPEPILCDNITAAFRQGKVVLSDIHRVDPAQRDHVDLVCPIFGPNARVPGKDGSFVAKEPPIAALVLRVRPEGRLFPLLAAWPEPTRTGETLLLREANGRLALASSTRFLPRAGGDAGFVFSGGDFSGAIAGAVEARDYRGTHVLVALRKVPGVPWFIATKLDRAEVVAPLRGVLLNIGLIAFALGLAVVGGTGWFWRRRELDVLQQQIAAEERFALIARSTSDVIWDWDRTTDEIWWSEGMQTVFGYPREDLVHAAASWSSHIHPDDLSRVLRSLEQAATGTPPAWTEECRFRRRDGSYAIVTMRGFVIRDGRGVAIRMVGGITDVSERRRLEATVALRDQQLKGFFRSAPAGLALFDAHLRYVEINDALADMHGVPADAHHGRTMSDVVPALASTIGSILERVLTTGQPLLNIEVTGETPRAPGLARHWLESFFPVFGPEGRVAGVGACVIEITDRKRVEDTLRESEERFRQLTENLDGVFWMSTPDGAEVIYVSPAYEPIWGQPADSLRQNPRAWLEAVHPDDRADADAALRVQRETGRFDAVFRICRTDGVRWVHSRGFPVRDSTGKIYRIAGVAYDITERKQLEVEVVRRERQLDAFFRCATVGLQLLDAELRFLRINDTLAGIHGLAPREHIGRAFVDVAPAFAPTLLPVFRRVLETGEPEINLEISHHAPDGGTRHWLGSLFPLNGHGRSIEGVGAILVEITDRKADGEALRSERQLLRTLIDHIPDAIYVKDRESRFLLANNAVAQLAGAAEPAELLGRTDHEFFPAALAHRFRSDEQIVLGGGTVLEQEETITRPGAEEKTLLTTKLPLRNERGDIVGLVGVGRDITERRRAAEAIRESEQRFRQLAESVREVFWMAEPDHSRMLYVSPPFEKVWGRTCESLYADPGIWRRAIHPEDRDRARFAVARDEISGDYDQVYRVVRPDGSIRWIRDRAYPVRDADGRVYRIVGTADDITEQRALEEQVRQSQKLEAIGTLAGGIAHDFNNILASIAGYTALAEMMVKRKADPSSHLAEVLRASERATALVRQILAFGRRQEQKRVPLRLGPVVSETLKLLRATIPSTIDFEISLAPELPAVLADATQIHQVVMNLGTNAWHAMRDRAGVLRIALAMCEVDAAFAAQQPGLRAGEYVRLTVADTGCGIEPAILRRIFEPFFTTKAPGEGTGLGLAVVHGIVRSHEGVVTVASEVGRGTTFQLYFPAILAEVAPSSAPAGRVPRGEGQRILIVDDEEPIARMQALALVELGYTTETHTQASTALAAFRAAPEHFDLVVTDQTMPQMTGLALATEIARLRPGLPILLTSGYSAAIGPEAIAAAGVRQLLLKPVSFEALGVAVNHLLQPPSN